MRRFLFTILISSMMFVSVPTALAETATIVVNTTSDTTNATDGKCSLREAITAANANVPSGSTTGECSSGTMGRDVIGFDIAPLNAWYKIQPTSALPNLVQNKGALALDGTTQPGYAGTPIIWLDGSLAGQGTNGISSVASDVTIRGLAITGYSGSAIFLSSSYPSWTSFGTIQSNYIGLSPDGVTVIGNFRAMRLNGFYNQIGGPDRQMLT
jgi:CSLREA domain-containing protein